MGVGELLALVSGILKFLPEIRKLIKVLSESPAHKAALITQQISDEADRLKSEGRPTWEK
ncbi:MAG: hypothetical protein EB120_13305 [Proteobacteria bacterium]|nr:hypothetical protein [Pseudomonadota bacterium]